MFTSDEDDGSVYSSSESESASDSECSSPPSLSPGVQKNLLTRVQANVLFITTKKNIYRSMFSIDAMPPTEDEQDAMIRGSIESASEEISGYSLEPHLADKFHKRCTPIMSDTWLEFRDSADMTTNSIFKLYAPFTPGENVDMHAHRRARLKDIFVSDDEFAALHVHDGTGTTLYFEHECIQNVISHVVWRRLRCGDVLQPESMAPLVCLAAASFIIALQRRKIGFRHSKPATHE